MRRTARRHSRAGSMKRRHSKSSKRHMSRRRHVKKGGAGLLGGLEGLVKTALVPFGLYAAQKTMQRRSRRK